MPASREDNWAYLSSGTWSLLGAEIPTPVVSEAARSVPFTNERGTEGKVRFLKNIAGLWLVQELRRELANNEPALGFDLWQQVGCTLDRTGNELGKKRHE